MKKKTPLKHPRWNTRKYLSGKPKDRLRMAMGAYARAKNAKSRHFISGRMLELTWDMEMHPKWFEHGCACATCRSYG